MGGSTRVTTWTSRSCAEFSCANTVGALTIATMSIPKAMLTYRLNMTPPPLQPRESETAADK
jgi:hypothetical protein